MPWYTTADARRDDERERLEHDRGLEPQTELGLGLKRLRDEYIRKGGKLYTLKELDRLRGA